MSVYPEPQCPVCKNVGSGFTNVDLLAQAGNGFLKNIKSDKYQNQKPRYEYFFHCIKK